ncbi:MAG: right-handed parallel beta-helix repeat-containing protein [Phycisphaerae bacterium]
MDGLRFSLVCAVAGAALAGCQPKVAQNTGNGANHAGSTANTTPDRPKRRVVRVSTVEQFIDAIEPNTIIQLAAGTYDVSKVAQKKRTFVVYEDSYDGSVGDLVIRNVPNLTIAGPAGRGARIVTPERYSRVLTLRDCRGVELAGLTVGHSPGEGYCTGGVVRIEKVRGLTVINCDLFGCGTEGLEMTDVAEATFRDTIIRDCTYGILTLRQGSNITFRDCRFAGNKEFHGVVVHDSEAVTFRGCTIEKNVLNSSISSPLFKITSSSAVKLIDSIVRANTYPAFQSANSPLRIERTRINGNTLHQGK